MNRGHPSLPLISLFYKKVYHAPPPPPRPPPPYTHQVRGEDLESAVTVLHVYRKCSRDMAPGTNWTHLAGVDLLGQGRRGVQWRMRAWRMKTAWSPRTKSEDTPHSPQLCENRLPVSSMMLVWVDTEPAEIMGDSGIIEC